MHAPIPFADKGGTPAWRAPARPCLPSRSGVSCLPCRIAATLALLAAASRMCFQGVRDQRAL
jgi:hypothetical protein